MPRASPSMSCGRELLHQKTCTFNTALTAESFLKTLLLFWSFSDQPSPQQFSVPGRRDLFTHKSHACLLKWSADIHKHIHYWSLKKNPSSLSWALFCMPIMNPFTTMSSGILCQTSIIYFGNPSKSWARKQWLFLKRLNLLNSVLIDGKAKNVYIRPHETWTADITKNTDFRKNWN